MLTDPSLNIEDVIVNSYTSGEGIQSISGRLSVEPPQLINILIKRLCTGMPDAKKQKIQSELREWRMIYIAKQYASGSTPADIGKFWSISKGTVRQIIKVYIYKYQKTADSQELINTILARKRELNSNTNYSDAVKEQRWIKIAKQYANGATLGEVGSSWGLSRERIRQIIIHYKNIYSNNPEHKKTIDKIVAPRKVLDKLLSRKNELFTKAREEISLRRFIAETQLSYKALKKYFPETLDLIRENQEWLSLEKEITPKTKEIIQSDRKYFGPKRWSINYDKCLRCGTIKIHHRSNGYCVDCYSKSPVFRELAKKSYIRHREERLGRNREYIREYRKRSSAQAQRAEYIDQVQFGGNRERAIKRDGGCVFCRMVRTDCKREFGRDFVVSRINLKHGDNRLENLVTLCWGCKRKYFWSLNPDIRIEIIRNGAQSYYELHAND